MPRMNAPTGDATVHLRVPAATKASWIRASRAQGLRLTDWIIKAVEADMLTKIRIPEGLDFSALRLERDSDTGDVSFDTAVIARIEAASGLPDGFFMEQPEDALASLITTWYRQHLAAGGAPDPVADDLIAEATAEDAAGQRFSHPASRA